MRRISLFLLTLCVLLTACSGPKPEATLRKFERAYNKLDVAGMLDCIDPAMSRGVKAVINLTGGMLGVDITQMLDMVPLFSEMLPMFGDVGVDYSSSMKPKIRLSFDETVVNGDYASVLTTIEFTQGNRSESAHGWFELEKIDGDWYITGVSDV